MPEEKDVVMTEQTEENVETSEVPRRNKRIRNLIFVSTLSAIVLIASTYAWFIGMQEVNVDTFEVEIAAADSLLLSLDGADWKKTIKFTEKEIINEGGAVATPTDENDTTAVAYSGNKNNWPSKGLVPISSIGEMDSVVSEMKMFEKSSMATTPGGFRIMASRVNNYGATELEGVKVQDGYVAFDLFVKNYTGTQYIPELNPEDEEDIYLTSDSSVTVAQSEGAVANTGIENSVRVAFAQIGRVNGFNTNQSIITGIECTNKGAEGTIDYATGICRTAQIWEPNDVDHVDAAISWYQKSCLKRTGSGITATSYDVPTDESAAAASKCKEVVQGTSYPTYAIKDNIISSDNVDIYDGEAYNGYDTTNSDKLFAYPYFTDTMKKLKGTKRPTFIKLAPNSITKVRVYVYIEGQDIDNYDFSSIGKRIAVKFGFSKERFTTGDIDYSGPTSGMPPEVVTD